MGGAGAGGGAWCQVVGEACLWAAWGGAWPWVGAVGAARPRVGLGPGPHLHRRAHVLTGEPLEAEPHVVVGAPRGLWNLYQNRFAAAVHPVGQLLGCRGVARGATLGPEVTGHRIVDTELHLRTSRW